MSNGPWKVSLVMVCALMMALLPTAMGADQQKARLIQANSDGQVIEQSFGPFTFKEVTQEGSTYHRVMDASGLLTEEPGMPEVPLKSVLVAVPEGVSITLETLETETSIRSDFPIYPAPRFEAKESADSVYLEERFYSDPVAYGRNAFFPESPASIERVGKIRDLPVVRISFHPIQYNPATKTMREHSTIKVKLNYGMPAEVAQRNTGPMGNICSRNVVGYNAPPAPKGSSKGTISYPSDIYAVNSADYLILTSSREKTYYYDNALTDFNNGLPYSHSINKLAQARTALNNYDVAVVCVDDIIGGNEVESIKTFVEYVYDNWDAPNMPDNHLGYLLLVGNFDDITSFFLPDDHGHGPGYADRYFGCIGDEDFSTPDLMMGRISVDDYADLQVIVDKTIAYEDVSTGGATDWREKILYVEGTVNSYPNYDFIKETLIENGGFEYHEVFDELGQGPTEINANFNDGRWIVTYCGHGGVTNWENYHYHNFPGMNNGSMLPLVMSLACMTGQYWTSEDCMGEYLTHTPNKGAVAFWGASKTSTSGSFKFTMHLYNNMYIDYEYGLGELLNYGLVELNGAYREYNLLGDPALDLSLSTSRPGLPDLAVRYSNLHLQEQAANEKYITAEVDNIGETGATSVPVRFGYIDDLGIWNLIGDTTIPEILEGESAKANMVWNTSDPEHQTLTIQVDSDGVITESYENNNQAGAIVIPSIVGTEYIVRMGETYKSSPDVSDNIMVWSESIDGDSNIYGYDIETGQSFTVYGEPGGQYTPAIDGDLVVWLENEKENRFLRVKNLATGELIDITAGNYPHAPDISGHYVVWQEVVVMGEESDIYYCDLDTMHVGAIFPDDRTDQSLPAIYDDFVVWKDNRGASDDIYGHRINSPIMEPTLICTDPGTQTKPQIFGTIVVWECQEETPSAIKGYNMTTYESYDFGKKDKRQISPFIYDKMVTWLEYPDGVTGAKTDVFACNIGKSPVFAVCTHPETQSYPLTDGEIFFWTDRRDVVSGTHIYALKPGPVAPEGLQGVLFNGDVQLSWNGVAPPLHGYRIYRNIHPSTTDFELLKTIYGSSTFCVDESPVKGAHNYYKVSAFIEYPLYGEGNCSDVISVFVPKKKPDIHPNMRNP